MKIKLFFVIMLTLFSISAILAQDPSITASGNQDRISLDIKGMDIVDVLKMLATRAGINIVVGKNVTGKVTLFLKDVDIKDAFEIILLANELAYEEKEGIINVMTQRDYELLYGERYQDKKQARLIQLKYTKAAELSKALTQIKTNIGRIVVDEGSNTLVLIDSASKLKEMEDFISLTDLPQETHIFSLNYASADKLQAKIQEALTKGVGYLRIDERTNKIVVTDYPKKLDEIARVISAFDEKTPQVLIDAQIIEIQPKDEFKMGVDWDYWIKKNFRTTLPLVGGSSIGFGATQAVSGLGDYKIVLDLLRTIGETQILSSPRIAALNNQEAKILIGTKEVYVSQTTSQGSTGTQVTADQVNFVDVGIKLYVTPTINQDGFITMKIKPEVSSVKRTYDYGTPLKSIPVVETSEAETTVMIKDGVTIIIGGLKKDKRKKDVSKIPVLGDIPLLGFLFRKTSDALEKSDLVILLTPHILSGADAYTEFTEIKPREGAVAKMVKGNIITEKITKPQELSIINDTTTDYYKHVKEKVMALVSFQALNGEKGEVGISFTLNSDGRLKDEPRIVSSNNQNLNPIAIKCVENAAPFLTFPADLNKKEESFRIILVYK